MLPARTPVLDGTFSVRKRVHAYFRPVPQKAATSKWYRSVHAKNLTERSDGSSGRISVFQSSDSEAGAGTQVASLATSALTEDFVALRTRGGSKLGRNAVKIPMAGRNEHR